MALRVFFFNHLGPEWPGLLTQFIGGGGGGGVMDSVFSTWVHIQKDLSKLILKHKQHFTIISQHFAIKLKQNVWLEHLLYAPYHIHVVYKGGS